MPSAPHFPPVPAKSFSLIPVIDLQEDLAVHARGGERQRYQPLATPPGVAGDPKAIIAAYLQLAPFHQIYIADLNAIAGDTQAHRSLLQGLGAAFPRLGIWLDAGFSCPVRLHAALDCGFTPVIGSEGLQDPGHWQALTCSLARDACILSLDCRNGQDPGNGAMASRPGLWPSRVIAMSLSRVGSGLGPDLCRLGRLRRLAAPACRLYAAGGIRGKEDLVALLAHAISGALLATALHNGGLSAGVLGAFCQDPA